MRFVETEDKQNDPQGENRQANNIVHAITFNAAWAGAIGDFTSEIPAIRIGG